MFVVQALQILKSAIHTEKLSKVATHTKRLAEGIAHSPSGPPAPMCIHLAKLLQHLFRAKNVTLSLFENAISTLMSQDGRSRSTVGTIWRYGSEKEILPRLHRLSGLPRQVVQTEGK